jgi:hypothetical protein
MRFFPLFAIIVSTATALSSIARADQLECNSEVDAKRASALLPEGAIMLDFCSHCTAPVVVVRVDQARVFHDCEFEVQVSGVAVAKTAEEFSNGFVPQKAHFSKQNERYDRPIDLAYAYVEVAPNDFRWIGGVLGLKAEVRTISIKLPAPIYDSLGNHVIGGKNAGTPVAEPTVASPEPAEVLRVATYYAKGQGRPPILAELAACLDAREGACAEVLKRDVRPGTDLFACTEWLVPKGDRPNGITVDYELDGASRTKRGVALDGKTLPARACVSARVDRPGLWRLVVRQGGSELGAIEVPVTK